MGRQYFHSQAFRILEVNKPKPVILYEIVKGWLTGKEPELGETHKLERAETVR